MASAKAGDAILGVNIPPTAAKLRRLDELGANWCRAMPSASST